MRRGPRRLDPLKNSLWRVVTDPETGEKWKEKSCPSCSKKAGVAVYLKEEAFGLRTHQNGRVDIEPWCKECR